MRAPLLTITLLAISSAVAATTVYTWVDDQGVTHYSDQPHQGATKLHVSDPSSYAPASSSGAPETAATPGGSIPHAQACTIDSPTDQQMFMNAWSVSGHIQLPPGLDSSDRVLLMLDGKVLTGVADLGGNFNIANIARGAHTVAAQVQSASGQIVCQSPQVTFYVHQPSQQAPNAVNRPRF
ncbi:MAG TPA: DUF4124 domain-containing protein [Steroidobacteraceae bacterium]|nr:DUF4124 domain-containing protein [Steroidobacteraceae bacterium]